MIESAFYVLLLACNNRIRLYSGRFDYHLVMIMDAFDHHYDDDDDDGGGDKCFKQTLNLNQDSLRLFVCFSVKMD